MRIEANSMQFRLVSVYGSARVGGPDQVGKTRESSTLDPRLGEGLAMERVRAARIVAAVVPGGIDFAGDSPQPSRAALPLYHHPADRNAAATSIELGRTIDLQG